MYTKRALLETTDTCPGATLTRLKNVSEPHLPAAATAEQDVIRSPCVAERLEPIVGAFC
jgi:hypothetical protein